MCSFAYIWECLQGKIFSKELYRHDIIISLKSLMSHISELFYGLN